MKKVLLSLLMATSLVACGEKTEAPKENEKPVVKIGVSFPLTGNMSAIGNAAHKALRASIDDVNKNQNNKYYYELVVENDQMDPKQINSIAHKFIHNDKVNVIVSYFSVAGRIVAPLAAQNKIVNFNFGFGDDVLQSKYNFQNFLTVDDENTAVLEFLVQKNVKNVDLIYQNIGAADEFLEPLKNKLDENNIAYSVHRFNKGERDFNILVSKVKESSSDAVFIYAFEPEADILTSAIRQQNVGKIIAYNDGLPMTNNYQLYEGYYNIGSLLTPQQYQQAWGLEGQNSAYAIYLYDTGKIIAEAFENAKKANNIPSADEVSEYLLGMSSYSGIITDYLVDEKGQFHSKGQTTVVKDGKLIVEE